MTCPKLNVSRAGSNTAMARNANAHGVHTPQPFRRRIGTRYQRRSTATAAAFTPMLIATATGHEVATSGAKTSAANGGYVKP